MDMTVSFAGLTLDNPIITASGTFGYGVEYMRFGDLGRLGAMVVKGLSLEPRRGNLMPRIAETPAGMLNAIGLQNIGAREFVEKRLPALPWAKTPVIANLYACEAEEFGELAAYLAAQEGIAALEVNISCPNVSEGGILFGQDPRLAARVTEAVKRRAGSKPVIVKLTPNVTDIAAMARAAQDAGADALSLINTLSGMAVDARTRRPRLANVVGGLSGPAIKPVALRCVWQVCQAVKIPVIGIGGIASAEDVLEFILVGATAVQVGTANFIRPDAAFRLVDELPALCATLGVESWDAYRGSLKA
ncbi:dihydroorotate dehydrogenase [Desulfocurvus vexinensis]|uniref:dihydroorotate dehydrogenase n=1 Tax=Desulfocurvus vexinensis TaxID=399548 RepID=UPI00048D9054|nr:dihydroorotate dehydrogenase [Desulfocurvus vexinensis]